MEVLTHLIAVFGGVGIATALQLVALNWPKFDGSLHGADADDFCADE